MQQHLIIGIDDTDSKQGMCTTYLAAVLIEKLGPHADIEELPLLIRLNPTIPYKTRGNGAIAIRLKTARPELIEEITINTVQQMAELQDPNTNPGIVIAPLENGMQKELGTFTKKAIQQIVALEEAQQLIDEHGLQHKAFKNGRGLIGALAAVGATDLDDYTYELITYRHPGRWGTPRDINEEAVWLADRETYPQTWDTVDHEHRKMVFAPHSPCPVLYGIRGDDPHAILNAHEIIQSEPTEYNALFKTNQGTDMHLIPATIEEARSGQSYIIRGVVSRKARTIAGGHVIFAVNNHAASIDCAAYEPTKNFRKLIRKLQVGDEVEVYGSVSDHTLNLEKIRIWGLSPTIIETNPQCPVCGKNMKSAGQKQGYRCRTCKTKAKNPREIQMKRDIKPGLYETPPVARRHISKPLIRMTGASGIQIYPSR